MRRIMAVAVLALFLPGSSPAQVVVTAPNNAQMTDAVPGGASVLPSPPPAPSETSPIDAGNTSETLTPMNRLALSPVPEPSTLMLTAAMLGLGAVARLRWAARWRRELEAGEEPRPDGD